MPAHCKVVKYTDCEKCAMAILPFTKLLRSLVYLKVNESFKS